MSLQVLVIDDDIVDREAVRRYLSRGTNRSDNIQIQEAGTGREALYLLEQTKFDCVFLDYQLPDMDGITLLKKFYNPDTDLTAAPVVMLTGHGSESVMVDAIRWGAQDYLIKDNISPDTLKIAMKKAREFYEVKMGRRHAEEQLQQARKMEAVGQLTSGISHDFNNLLTVILGNTRLLGKMLQAGNDSVQPEDLASKIQAIDTAARRGAELVGRLMIFTRQRPLAMETANINTCISETFELIKRALGESIDVKMLLTGESWPVQVDISQFENALINIALNARDAMPGGGKLSIETTNIMLDESYAFKNPDMAAGPYVMIAISDTGCGMDPDVAKRIFEPFFTTKKAGEGTGLGLSMVYGFIRQSGGYIHVYSEPGHGTVFRIYLPKSCPDEKAKSAEKQGAEVLTGTETILIAEDDEKIRGVAAEMLARLGYKTLIAQNARVALEILRREHANINLLFTDITMPGGITGIELASQVREFYPGVRVLYTSGYTENAAPEHHASLKHVLISKPYRKEMLAQKIREVLDRRE